MKKILPLLLVLVMGVMMLVACGMSMDDIEANLEDADYEVVDVPNEDVYAALGEFEDILYAVDEDGNNVTVFECEDKEVAEELYDALKAAYKSLGLSCEVDGNFVFLGTKKAVKAAMGE